MQELVPDQHVTRQIITIQRVCVKYLAHFNISNVSVKLANFEVLALDFPGLWLEHNKQTVSGPLGPNFMFSGWGLKDFSGLSKSWTCPFHAFNICLSRLSVSLISATFHSKRRNIRQEQPSDEKLFYNFHNFNACRTNLECKVVIPILRTSLFWAEILPTQCLANMSFPKHTQTLSH